MSEAISAQGPNSDQIEYWNSEAAQKWVDFNPMLDRMLEPLSDLVMDLLSPTAGEHVLDIGCGCGSTTLELARRVAPGGAVTGLDISTAMLDLARERAVEAGAAATFINADAEIHALPASSFDLLFSRFGVMFFNSAKAAFSNLHGALKPGGRAAFVCWRDPDLNPWVTVPFRAAQPFAPAFEPPKSDEPGQFAFARKEWVNEVLTDAGFSEVRIEPHDFTQRIGDGDLESCVNIILRLGPVARLVREADEATAPAIAEAVRAAVAPYHTGSCIEMAASAWIVGARRP